MTQELRRASDSYEEASVDQSLCRKVWTAKDKPDKNFKVTYLQWDVFETWLLRVLCWRHRWWWQRGGSPWQAGRRSRTPAPATPFTPFRCSHLRYFHRFYRWILSSRNTESRLAHLKYGEGELMAIEEHCVKRVPVVLVMVSIDIMEGWCHMWEDDAIRAILITW